MTDSTIRTSALYSDLPVCTHPSVDIRASKCSNGTIHYVKQCLTCGEKVGGPLTRQAVIDARGPLEFILPFDEPLRETTREANQAARQTAWRTHQEALTIQRQAKRDDWMGWYADYLQSDAWRARRAKVLTRAHGICEGCLDARATEVHHLTYQHVGAELLFELVALCEDCHTSVHRETRVERTA